MKTNKQTHNWLLDVILFTVFLLAFFLDLTGVILHQYLGMICGMLILVHFLWHIRWVSTVTRSFFTITSKRTVLYFLLDALILISALVIIINGFVISTWLNLPLNNYLAWRDFHVFTSIGTLCLVLLKIGLHWRWIANGARKIFVKRAIPALELAPVQNSISRKDFLKVMGMVGVASLFAVRSALKDSDALIDTISIDTESSPTPFQSNAVALEANPYPIVSTAVPSQGSTVVPTQNILPTSTSAPVACIVRCDKHCSFPGSCRRYVDLNGNNLCDNGECL